MRVNWISPVCARESDAIFSYSVFCVEREAEIGVWMGPACGAGQTGLAEGDPRGLLMVAARDAVHHPWSKLGAKLGILPT